MIPGSSTFIDGDNKLGFYGEVQVKDFISGDQLINMVGLSAGTTQFPTEPWLKFSLNDKILFVTKKCIKYNISFLDLENVGVTYGTRILNIRGRNYRIRLLRGSSSFPAKWDNRRSDAYADPLNSHGSEWNELLYNVHVDEPRSQSRPTFRDRLPEELLNELRPFLSLGDFKFLYGRGIPSDRHMTSMLSVLPESLKVPFRVGVASLWRPYNDYQLNVADNYGRNSWCQESWQYDETKTIHVQRGCLSVDYATVRPKDAVNESFGWRPVLELI